MEVYQFRKFTNIAKKAYVLAIQKNMSIMKLADLKMVKSLEKHEILVEKGVTRNSGECIIS